MRAPQPFERQAKTFAGQSVEVLREMILGGRLVPGQRLNEVELSEALGISRGPLREAISRLASEGLLTVVSHRGAFVRTFDAQELMDLWELRIALETHAVRLVAQLADKSLLAGLKTMLADTRKTLVAEGGLFYPRDLDFHRGVVSLAKSARLLSATAEVHQQVHLARSRAGLVPERAQESYDEHEEVFQHIARRDADGAAAALATHLRASLASVLKLFPAIEDERDPAKRKPAALPTVDSLGPAAP